MTPDPLILPGTGRGTGLRPVEGLPRAQAIRKTLPLPRRLLILTLTTLGLLLLAQGAWIPAKAHLAQFLLARAWTQSVATRTPVRPWPWADATPIARIRVPRLGVEQIVLSGGSGEAMAFAPTLLPSTAVPGGRGTAVFAAHRDTHFAFLAQLRPGDVVLVDEVGGSTLRYRVTDGRVVRYDAFGVNRNSAPSIALTTCWPIGGEQRGPWRYAMVARMIT